MEKIACKMERTRYTQIVSLGCGCSVTYALRKRFNFRTAFPFDWWITPDEGLLLFLADGLPVERLYAVDDLEPTDGFRSIRHKRYGIALHHEFPRRWNVQGEPVVEDFMNFIESAKRRTAHLIDRLLSLNSRSERLLFVREPSFRVVPDGQKDQLHALIGALFPKANVDVAFVCGPDEEAALGWKRDPVLWEVELDRLGAELNPRRHRPFEETDAQNTDENVV